MSEAQLFSLISRGSNIYYHFGDGFYLIVPNAMMGAIAGEWVPYKRYSHVQSHQLYCVSFLET